MKKKKKPRTALTEREREFLSEYQKTGGNLPAICQTLGISHTRAQALLNAPLVKDRIARSTERARDMISASAPYLVQTALDLIESEDVSDKVKASLINSLLDRAGVAQPKAPAVSISINTEISERARQILAERENQRIPTIQTTAEDVSNNKQEP